jgi:hypothetical protein
MSNQQIVDLREIELQYYFKMLVKKLAKGEGDIVALRQEVASLRVRLAELGISITQ